MMFSALALVAASLFAGVTAQGGALSDISAIPAACGTDCGAVIEVGTLCMQEYKNDTDIAACFCNGGLSSTDLTTCGSCLGNNGASSLATSIQQAGTTCQQALQTCAFSCDVTPCSSSDIPCQCSESYLQAIYDCASCNTAMNNTGVTLISDYNALRDSCVNQNYTATPTATEPLPSPTGQSAYVSPTLSSMAGSAAASSVSIPTSASSISAGSITASGSTTRASSSGASAAASSSAPASAAIPVIGQAKGAWMALAAAVCFVGGAATLL